MVASYVFYTLRLAIATNGSLRVLSRTPILCPQEVPASRRRLQDSSWSYPSEGVGECFKRALPKPLASQMCTFPFLLHFFLGLEHSHAIECLQSALPEMQAELRTMASLRPICGYFLSFSRPNVKPVKEHVRKAAQADIPCPRWRCRQQEI